MTYDIVIGIEVHCELKTNTKMFSNAPINFNAEANTQVELNDLAFPGVMPVVNERAVELGIMAAQALNMEIDSLLKFDRKMYFYSDLPKGFQITQQYYPLGKKGYLQLKNKKVGINRLHLEEDTAKQFHYQNKTLIDYNRCSIPLIEIVSEPDIASVDEAKEYIEELKGVLEFSGVSDVKMEEGSLRCDLNISLKQKASEIFGTKVEIKNINSISHAVKALEYEVERQQAILNKGQMVFQETRRYDEVKRCTIVMRTKDDAVSYRYTPEPNIPPIRISEARIQELKSLIPPLPQARRSIYLSYGLTETDSKILTSDVGLSNFFEKVVVFTKEYKQVSNWIISDLLGYLNQNKITLNDCLLRPEALAEMIEMQKQGDISSKQAKAVFNELVKGKNATESVKDLGLVQESNLDVIEEYVLSAIEEHPQAVVDYQNGKERAVGFLVGQVMKLSKGQANPQKTSALVVQKLKDIIE